MKSIFKNDRTSQPVRSQNSSNQRNTPRSNPRHPIAQPEPARPNDRTAQEQSDRPCFTTAAGVVA